MENPIDQRKSKEEFIQLLTEKAHMLRKHFKDTHCSLIMCANIRPNTTIFRLYNMLEKESLKFQSTITNSENLGEQFISIMVTIKHFNAKILSPFSNSINISYIYIFIENIMSFVVTILFNALFIQ